MVTRKGGPEVLQVVELPIQPPGPGQARVRVRCRRYEVAATMEAIGTDVTALKVGQRVAALSVYGGFAEFLVRGAGHFMPIPDGVSDRAAARPGALARPLCNCYA
jgi:NADPH:quinone reductase-like Zn-dependent oxidoreductase